MSPPVPCSCRALVPGAAPRDGRGHRLLSRVGVTRPRCLEDNAELMWGKPELGGDVPRSGQTFLLGASWVPLRVSFSRAGVSSL